MNLFLIGYRCTGKTTVGKMLARALGWGFADTDALVVETAGRSIAEIVAAEGWEAFRKLEAEALVSLCRQSPLVVATGGGVVLEPANRAAMKQSGSVIWLAAAPETISRRMAADAATKGFRPPLTRKDPAAEIRDTLAERTPLYEATADFTIATDHRDVAVIGEDILAFMKRSTGF